MYHGTSFPKSNHMDKGTWIHEPRDLLWLEVMRPLFTLSIALIVIFFVLSFAASDIESLPEPEYDEIGWRRVNRIGSMDIKNIGTWPM